MMMRRTMILHQCRRSSEIHSRRHDDLAATSLRGGAPLLSHSNNMSSLLTVVLFLVLFLVSPLPLARGFSFVSNSQHHHTTTSSFWQSTCSQNVVWLQANNKRNSDDDDGNTEGVKTTSLESFIEKQKRQSLVEALFNLDKKGKSRLVQVHLQGKASLATGTNKTNWFFGSSQQDSSDGDCLVLSFRKPPSTSNTARKQEEPIPCMLVPLVNVNQLSLVQASYLGYPFSNTRLYRLNMMAINRDAGLFDNIPWNTWTIDPMLRNRDAAGNTIESKFHLGKRDAYNVMMGKDWRGQSLAMTNLALQLRQKLKDKSSSSSSSTKDDDNDNEEEDAHVLTRRLIELQIKELEMDIAECDYQLAILTIINNNKNPENQESSSSQQQQQQEKLEEVESNKRQALIQDLQTLRERLQQMTTSKQSSSSLITQVLDQIQQNANNSPNKAPYRGAMGYDPYLDSTDDVKSNNNNNEPYYTCPYDMLGEIIENQLQAQVIGTVLENTSWLSNTITLGGVLVLRRKTAQEQVSIAGQSVIISNEQQDYGNPGIRGGETFLVECDADEVISMSLACNIPLQVESLLLERSSVMAQPKQQQQRDDIDSTSSYNVKWSKSRHRRRRQGLLPEWETVDPELSILFEGQAGNMSSTERVAPIRIPRTTMSLYDSLFEPQTQQQSQGMFPTDNPVQSLSAYDAMSNEEKAILLMTMSNFPRDQRIPRPRTVRQSEQQQQGNKNSGGDTPLPKGNVLDDLLLPLIDESVRREYRLRDAQLRGDLDLLEQLQRETSRRQVVMAKVAQARANAANEKGNDGVVGYWQKEADLYDSLKADVTQDDGSYSRFLDKDEDYERNRRRLAARVNKKKFGTLLDGMD